MAVFKRILIWVAGAWLLVAGLMYVFQRRLQYFPDTDTVPHPGREGLEDVRLTTEDGVELHAWYWPGKRPGTLLVFHGNAGHRGHRLSWIEGFHARGWGVFLLDYRGYGGSGGTPTQSGFFKDADAAADFLAARGVEKIAYYGRSIGSGVALDIASRRPAAALVIESGAVSMADVAAEAYPLFPVRWMMKDSFDARDKLARIPCPGMFVHGDLDRIIPMSLGRTLYDLFPGEKEWFEVTGAGHNDTAFVGDDAYYDRIDAWLAKRLS
ncbi:MAG: alpha/beta hydrolase [Planctomycetota bacterium]